MARPVFIEPAVNKDSGDCAISCLVMWTGRTYPAVVAAAPPKAYKRGMSTRAIIETAGKLGTVLVQRRRFNLHEDDGILMLSPVAPHTTDAHAVVLLDGKVLDPYNGRLWLDIDIYLATEHYKASALLVDEEGA